MSNKLAVQRLIREQQKMQQSPNKQLLVVPSSENIFEWHFILYNFEKSPFEGGQFHGKLLIPAEYPMKPPTLVFVTPNGRFKPGEKICLSFTSFHPESWSTSWTIESMLIGLLSFMHTNEATVGSITTTDAVKRQLAGQSIKFNLANQQFTKIFHSHYEKLGIDNGLLQVTESNQSSNGFVGEPNIQQNNNNNQQEDDQTLNLRKLMIFIAIVLTLAGFYVYLKAKKVSK